MRRATGRVINWHLRKYIANNPGAKRRGLCGHYASAQVGITGVTYDWHYTTESVQRVTCMACLQMALYKDRANADVAMRAVELRLGAK